MRRMTLLVALTAAAIGVTAPNAVAAVQVDNPGTHTIDAGFTLHYQGMPGTAYECGNSTFQAEISSDGHVALNDVVLDGHQSVPYGIDCARFDDCDDAGLSGQILGPEDEGFPGTDGLGAIFPLAGHDMIVLFQDWCLDYDDGAAQASAPMYWGIDGSGESQEWTLIAPQFGWGTSWRIASGSTHLAPAESIHASVVE